MGGYQGKGKKEEDGLLLKHAFCWRAQRARVSRKHGCVFALFSLSDLYKASSCMSWPKELSAYLFSSGADCQDQSHLLVLANMM